MRKLKKEMSNYTMAKNALRKSSMEYIISMLQNHNNECVFDLENDEYVTVAYDGGNHPETQSNLFSQVYKVWRTEDESIYLQVEDCDEYNWCSLEAEDLYYLAEMMEEHFYVIECSNKTIDDIEEMYFQVRNSDDLDTIRECIIRTMRRELNGINQDNPVEIDVEIQGEGMHIGKVWFDPDFNNIIYQEKDEDGDIYDLSDLNIRNQLIVSKEVLSKKNEKKF